MHPVRHLLFATTLLMDALPAPAGVPQLVKDINAGSGSSYPAIMTPVGNTVYFVANDGTTGIELWKSDGTAAGTVLVKDITAGSGHSAWANDDLKAVGDTHLLY